MPEWDSKAIEFNDRAVEEFVMFNSEVAVQLLDSALSLEPNYSVAFVNKMAAYNQLHDYQNTLKTALEYSGTPEFPSKNYSSVAMAYERTGEFDKSITFYKKALEHFEGNDWEDEPLISQIDFAIFTTFVDGKTKGLEKLEEILESTPPKSQETELIERLRNEINFYQGGGYKEIQDQSNAILFCVDKSAQEATEREIKKAGINFAGWSSNGLTGQLQYKIKPKFVGVAKSIGLTECEK
jgi:tetratricopeptide (TPR) repeat protein